MTETCARRRPAARSGPHRWSCALTVCTERVGCEQVPCVSWESATLAWATAACISSFSVESLLGEKRSKKVQIASVYLLCVCVCEAIHLISPSSTRVERQRHLGEATSPSALVQSEREAPSYAVAGLRRRPVLSGVVTDGPATRPCQPRRLPVSSAGTQCRAFASRPCDLLSLSE